ncbi:MAG: hypothetical protein GFH27_549309n98 [Chloroflexi bacterium AL-W]|nr:hypothetical protein [Chloroflexi bacterium AL-N1]NOK69800.1 hypothetical protein [Chloroflexi bacterium AL-N10]NOK73596.1 hypothetical protein [Chloroflexi bacterium AL-N5]NOK83970.1 hypothetical protein [Chloroflexi bacterium AL-W]NOK87927.1 hypothetical protein [Chloroflexi bacterium AL-N15]
MSQQPAELTVTLHWRHAGQEYSGVAALTDSPPVDLIAVLVDACGVPRVDQQQHRLRYELRLGSEQRMPLEPEITLSAQGVRTGYHVWLVPVDTPRIEGYRWLIAPHERETIARAPRCLLRLPDGSEINVRPQGQALTRTWLLAALQLHNPAAHVQELERGDQSPYRYVSNQRVHCTIRFGSDGDWLLSTTRDDVVTEVNQQVVRNGYLTTLNDGDVICLGGAYGLRLEIIIVG